MSHPSSIIRIDDRLIHGQVLVGWSSFYPIKHIIVGNDQIAKNDWEKKLLMMAAPEKIETRILPLNETVNYIAQHQKAKDTSLILIKSVDDILTMAGLGLPPQRVNVGGIHYSEGREEYLSYLFLDKHEVEVFKELIQKGFVFYCQDIPNNASHDLRTLLERKSS